MEELEEIKAKCEGSAGWDAFKIAQTNLFKLTKEADALAGALNWIVENDEQGELNAVAMKALIRYRKFKGEL